MFERPVVVRGKLLVGLGFVVFLLLALAGVASGASVHPFVSSFGGGVVGAPMSVAVDEGTGDVYVLDVSNATVNKFDSSGNPASFSALGTSVLDGAGGGDCAGTPSDCDQTPQNGLAFDGSVSGAQIAVDNSSGPAAHDIYVTNSFSSVVSVFDQTGTYVGQLDGTLASPQSGGEVTGVAVAPSGDVYVSSVAGHVDHYSVASADPASDVFVSQLENLVIPGNVAVDSAGAVYVTQYGGFGPTTRYDASQLGLDTPIGTAIDNASMAVAVDPTTDDAYVDEGNQVAQYDTSGTKTGRSGFGTLSGSSFGVAIRGTTGELFASDAGSAPPRIDRFGPAVAINAPSVSDVTASNVTSTGADLSGTVNPQGTDPLSDTTWHFEYSTDGGNSWSNTTGGDAGTGTSDVPVTDSLTGLLPNQPVQVRLVATNAADSATSAIASFTTTTIKPDVTAEPVEDVALTHASLQGLINPNNAATTYHFEYGTTTNYGTNIPVPDSDAGTGSELEAVIQAIYGLQPGTTYHYRLVATNTAGTTNGTDQTFTTTTPAQPTSCPNTQFRHGHAAALPDCRAWELVSPPDKEGGDVVPLTSRVHAAGAEIPGLPMAVSFTSLKGFADARSVGIGSEYLAQRTLQPNTNGWSTYGITPPQQPVNVVATVLGNDQDPHYVGDFSRDLTHAVFSAWSPVAEAPNVAQVPNLYLRNDLRAPGFGSWTLLTASATTLSPSVALSYFADASTDFSHVIFESFQSLTPDVPPCTPAALGSGCPPHLYEAVDGIVRLAGVLPDGTAAPSSVAGQGVNVGVSNAHFVYHTISDDGRRIFFTVKQGRRQSDLYMRTDGTTTVQINAPEDHGAAGTVDPGPSTFWDASSDGSRAFFTGGGHLYMYSVQPDGNGNHLSQLDLGNDPEGAATASTIGVIGTSDDGHYVYFIEAGQLVAGKPISGAGRGVYVWHDELGTPQIDYVGRLASTDTTLDLNHSWVGFPQVTHVTPDGGHLLFAATDGSGLTGYDQSSACTGGCTELYEYSVHGDGPDHVHLHCATCNPSGMPATMDATDAVQNTSDGGLPFPTDHASDALSNDGRFVFFHTSEALVPQDVNGKIDVYEYDLRDGSVHLLSSGTDLSDSYFADASADGHDVFINTRAQLAGWDHDGARDLYDVRIDGGVPDPPPALLPCAEAACRVVPSAPSGSAAGSETSHGAGDVHVSQPKAKPKRRRLACRRGFVKKRVKHRLRCVRKPRHRRVARRTRRATVPVHAHRKGR